MTLARLQRHWDEFGRRDPYWAVLTDPAKAGNKWDPDEFFATGRAEVAQVLEWASVRGVTIRRSRALDFGCGVGRLTQALGDHFEQVTGVDIAPSMLELAQQHNRHGARCEYVLNEREDLGLFPGESVDFIYSRLVLQHLRPALIRSYLREFVRLLDGGGVAIFNLPVSPLDAPVSGGLKARLPRWLIHGYRRVRLEMNDRFRFPSMEVNGLKPREVVTIVESAGATVVVTEPDQTHGDAGPGFLYCVAKSARRS